MDGSIVPVTASSGGKPVRVYVEIGNAAAAAAVADDPEQDVSIFRRGKSPSGKPLSLEDLADSIAGVAEAMTSAIRRVAPDEGEVEFGIDIGIESGQLTSLIVKGTANSTLKVRLLWKNS